MLPPYGEAARVHDVEAAKVATQAQELTEATHILERQRQGHQHRGQDDPGGVVLVLLDALG